MSQRTDLGELHRAILTVALATTVLIFVGDVVTGWNGPGRGAAVRAPLYLAAIAAEMWERRRPRPNATWVLAFVAVLVALATLLEHTVGRGRGFAPDPVTAAAVIFSTSIAAAALAPRRWLRPLAVAYLALFVPWMGMLAVIEGRAPEIVVMRMVVAAVLLGVGGWLVWRLRTRLEDLAAERERHARLHEAVAGVSESLMSVSLLDPLGTAARAIRDGFGAEEVVVIRLTGPNPGVTAASDAGDVPWDRPPGEIIGALATREPIRGPAGEWPPGLYFPVAVGGSVVGLLGVVGTGDVDASAYGLLGAVAEMVGSFWERVDAQHRLEELVRSKDELVAAVSHELRTPLTAVLGLAAELTQRWEDLGAEEVREFTTIISEQSRDMADIVEDLLVAARADLGTLSIRPDKVDLRAEVESVVATGSLRAQTAVTKLEVEGEAVFAWADALRCRQVIRNLVTNALRYGGERIRITVAAAGGRSMVEVADDGPGLDEVEGARIFEPYYRARQIPTQPGSVGLGLAVSRQLAQLMGGDVRYERRDDWTVFVLELPGVVVSA